MAKEVLGLSTKGADQGPRFHSEPARRVSFRVSRGRVRGRTPTADVETTLTLEEQIRDLSSSIINTYSRFDMHLKTQGDFVVDGYFVGPSDAALILPLQEEEALARFREDIGKIGKLGFKRLPPEWHLIHDNLVSTVTYFEECERLSRGEKKMDYREYLLKVSGIELRLIPWKVLDDEDYSKALEILSQIGLKFNGRNPASVRAALFTYKQFKKYDSPVEISERFKFYDNGHRFQVGMALGGLDLRKVDFRTVWVVENAWWRMYERMGLEGNTLFANWHERHRQSWDEGSIEMYATHEPLHFYYGYLVREEILKGNLDPAAGILPIPSPGCHQFEGIAQTVSHFASIDLSLDAQLAIGLYRLEKRALSNGLYLLETDPTLTIDQVADRIRTYIPLKNPEEIRTLLEEGTTRPFERAYLPIYGLADYEFMTFCIKANPQQKAKLLQLALSRPMTPAQLRQQEDRILKAA